MIPHSRPCLGAEEAAAAAEVVKSGHLAQGGKVAEFEAALARLVGAAGAVAVSSGTAALHLALLALDVGEGDEVVIPSFVCTALLNAVRYCRAEPVLADIDPETLNMGVRQIRPHLTKKTRAIIVPHLFGLPAEIREICALGVPVIEDCAQSLGSACEGKPTGAFGELAVFSFYATKVITTGEGGMVVARDRSLVEKMRDLRDYDEKPEDRLRYNYKMTDLQAAIGLVQLGRLPVFIARRRAIAYRYTEVLEGGGVTPPPSFPERGHIYFRYVIRTARLEEMIAAGGAAGIAYRRPVFQPLHRCLDRAGFPESEAAWRECLSVPIYPSLTEEDVEKIIAHLGSFFRG